MSEKAAPATTLDGRRVSRKAKSVSASRVELSQLMRPQHGNFAGKVHGGTILALMDEVAYTCASKFAEAYCVTVAVDRVEFLAPVEVGQVLTLKASVNHVGRTSMEVGIQITAEDPRHPGSGQRTNRCFFTMVALYEDGGPTEVPRLELETVEDRKWACEARMRRELRARYMEDLAAGICRLEEEEAGEEQEEEAGEEQEVEAGEEQEAESVAEGEEERTD